MKIEDNACDYCGTRISYVRHIQFAGDHYFCKTHGESEKDFHQPDDTGNYDVYWRHVNGNVPKSAQPYNHGKLKSI